ncbi:MAG: diphosphomevalonate decarboxylase [Bdellovibrionales bacterium]|nr:diphosphomevalonate decarboxylase [Bdellovibrionales bacterium]
MKIKLVRAQAPANIALIKYMGKADSVRNGAANSSLSYTLNHLCSFVEIESRTGNDNWEPLNHPYCHDEKTKLSPLGIQRFLTHFTKLKEFFHLEGSYIIRSGNNFPSDCGLASSASSFAALTLAAFYLSDTPSHRLTEDVCKKLARLSQQGSGSSCRSFFSPWSLWSEEGAFGLELPFQRLRHQVVLVEQEKKIVSSSSAHQRVITSLLFEGRRERAQKRLEFLLKSFRDGNWSDVFQNVWADFWEMHALFATSVPSFSYFKPLSIQVLNYCEELWRKNNDGPLVTMDAGANVHLLYREDQEFLANQCASQLRSLASIIDSAHQESKQYGLGSWNL